MRNFGVKKLVAIAAGAALVGTALAPLATAAVATIDKSDVYNPTTGAPIVNVAVGSLSAISDAVVAGNIATAIATNAVTTGTATCSVAGAVSGACDVTLGDVEFTVGGRETISAGAKEYKADLNSYSGSTAEYASKWLSDAQLDHLYNSSDSYKYAGSSYTITVKEYIGVNANPKFNISNKTIEDLVLYLQNEGDFNYTLDLGGGIPAYESATTTTTAFTDGTNDSIIIPWFGTKYTVDEIDLNNASGAYMKMIVSKAKEVYTIGESFTADGKGEQAGKTLTVTITNIVKTSDTAEYQATFQLTDEDGTVLDTQTTGDGAYVDFQDDEGDDIMETSVYVQLVAAEIATSEGYVELMKGANLMDWYVGKGYPYDSSNTTGPWDWQIKMQTDGAGWLTGACSSCVNGEKVKQISVYNSNLLWDDDNPIYPTLGALTDAGQAGQTEAALYDDYATIEFRGFETDEALTNISIGSDEITYVDGGDTSHTIPFTKDLSFSSGGSTFTFDTKTIWYKTNKTDVNFIIGTDNNMLNGIDAIPNNDGNLLTEAGFFGANQKGVTVDVNGVTYLCSSFQATGTINCLADGNITFRKDSSTGDLIGGANFNDTWFWDDYNTTSLAFDANPLTLTGANSQAFRYVLYANETSHTPKLRLLLAAVTDFSVQYSKDIDFQGTNSRTAESSTIAYNYYLPDMLEFGADNTDNNFMTAIFSVDEEEATTADYDMNVYINTATGDLHIYPNTNLTWPTVDVAYGGSGAAWNGVSFSLREDTPTSYTDMAYTDFGSKLVVANGVFTATIPESIPQVVMWVKGKEVTQEVIGGESLTAAEGASATTTGGTKVTIDKINYTGAVEGAIEDGAATCTVTPETYSMRAPGSVSVFTDKDAPATKLVVVGGYKVNALADPDQKDRLLAEGDYEVFKDATGNVHVAGFTAADTVRAGDALVSQVEAFT